MAHTGRAATASRSAVESAPRPGSTARSSAARMSSSSAESPKPGVLLPFRGSSSCVTVDPTALDSAKGPQNTQNGRESGFQSGLDRVWKSITWMAATQSAKEPPTGGSRESQGDGRLQGEDLRPGGGARRGQPDSRQAGPPHRTGGLHGRGVKPGRGPLRTADADRGVGAEGWPEPATTRADAGRENGASSLGNGGSRRRRGFDSPRSTAAFGRPSRQGLMLR